MINTQIREQIEAVLKTQLGNWGYAGAKVEDRPDSDGDPAIFIVANFKDPSRLPPSRVTTDAMVALRDALLAAGDERFPYLNYVYPDEPTSTEAA
jgi:hypothetical protein